MKPYTRPHAIWRVFLALMAFVLPQFAVSFVASMVVMTRLLYPLMSHAILSGETFELQEEQLLSVTQEAAQKLLDLTVPLTLIAALITLLILYTAFRVRRRSFAPNVGLYPMKPAQTLPLILCGLSLPFVLNLIFLLLPESWLASYDTVSSALMTSEAHPVLCFFEICLAGPIVEEIVFRGLIFTRMKKAFPLWAAVTAAALIFGLSHGQFLWILYAALLGLFFILVYLKYHTILATILLHISFNTVGWLTDRMPETGPALTAALYGAACAAFILSLILVIRTRVSDPPPFPPISEAAAPESGPSEE